MKTNPKAPWFFDPNFPVTEPTSIRVCTGCSYLKQRYICTHPEMGRVELQKELLGQTPPQALRPDSCPLREPLK